MQITIPCETFVRHAGLITPADDWNGVVRYENGKLISIMNQHVGDRWTWPMIVAEKIGGPDGVIHIIITKELLTLCQEGAAQGHELMIDVDHTSQWATAMLSDGNFVADNVGRWDAEGDNKYDRWRKPFRAMEHGIHPSQYGVYLLASVLAALAKAAPGGELVTESWVGYPGRPMLWRDETTEDWCAVVSPWKEKVHVRAAIRPPWVTLDDNPQT